MATTLTIAGIDKANLIDWKSLNVSEVLTKSPNMCNFHIKKFGTQTYKPTLGQEVVLTVAGTKEFGGYIVEINEKISAILS